MIGEAVMAHHEVHSPDQTIVCAVTHSQLSLERNRKGRRKRPQASRLRPPSDLYA
jgi:hypothetical protein